MRFKEGEYVKVVSRECTSADTKSGLFYGYFGGLCGTVDRIYEGKEVCLRIDPETLPQDVLKRHTEIQESMKRKWLNGLSGEARNRLTPEEKRFELCYTILVNAGDLEKAKKGEQGASGEPRPVAIKSARPLNPPAAPAAPEAAAKRTRKAAPKPDAGKPSAAKATSKAAAEPAGKPARRPAAGAEAGTAPSAAKTARKAKPPKSESNGDLTPAELEFLRQRERALKAKT